MWRGRSKAEVDEKYQLGTSLVVQRLRICPPVQGTQVQSLVREDPICLRATMPVNQDY